MSIKCLTDITITKTLSEAIARFERLNGDLDSFAGDFVTALVNFSKEQLEDHENFYSEPDKPSAITLCLFENAGGVEINSKYEEIEQRLHTIEGGDEIYDLIVEVINATVLTFDFPPEPQPEYLTQIKGYKYHVAPLSSRVDGRTVDSRPEVVLGGTVALGETGDWKMYPKDCWFSHELSDKPVLMAAIDDSANVPENAMFVSEKVSVSVCCAAAWLQVLAFCKQYQRDDLLANAKTALLTISEYSECYPVPMDTKESIKLFYLSRWVNFAFEMVGDRVKDYFGLKNNQEVWTIGERAVHDSEVFKVFTDWLREAALGRCEWPGATGEARGYLNQYEMDAMTLYDRIKVCNGVIVADGRGFTGEINPRHLIEWGQEHAPEANMILKVQDRFLRTFQRSDGLMLLRSGNSTSQELEPSHSSLELTLPASQYTLGQVPHHKKGSPLYSDRKVWERLTAAEIKKRAALGIPAPEGGWKMTGNYGGHSSYVDGYILTIPEVIAIMQSAD